MLKKAIISTAILFLFAMPIFVILVPINAQAANCGQSTNDPATPENDTQSCNGLVPCSGVDCTFCHLFVLAQRVFNFVVMTLVPLIAIAGVVWGGYMYLISGVKEDGIKKAKTVLKNTFIGMAITYGAFVVASSLIGVLAKTGAGAYDFGFSGRSFSFKCAGGGIVGGDQTASVKREFKDDDVEILPEIEFFSHVDSGLGANIMITDGVNTSQLNSNLSSSLTAASNELAKQGITLRMTSGYRTQERQAELVSQNCRDGVCNPPTCTSGAGCPHVAGKAVDVYGVKSGVNCEGSFSDSCQREVINAMKSQGFCVLKSEAWHFEKPKVSSLCGDY